MNIILVRTTKPGVSVILHHICSVSTESKELDDSEYEVMLVNGSQHIIKKTTLELALLESRLPYNPDLYHHDTVIPLTPLAS